jgi:hypothetical protein
MRYHSSWWCYVHLNKGQTNILEDEDLAASVFRVKCLVLGKRAYTRVYPKVSGLAVWSENCKWYSSLPLGAVVLLFCESF